VGGGLPEIPLVSVIHEDGSVGWAVARVVRAAGFGVELFATAEEFILSDQMPRTACLILDVQPPGMSGFQLQSHLAAAGRHIPIIFITVSADERVRARALDLGAVNLLEQPSGDKALLKELCFILKPRDKEGRTDFNTPRP
jgi:FixJ family two-component response regulator